MLPNPHAAQELDLLLQEGQADHALLLEGLVKLYAHALFRFAWEIYNPEIENAVVQRLLARRAVAQAFTTALRQLHRFQEQPGTYLWLLHLTWQNAQIRQARDKNISSLAARLHTDFNFSPEDIAYILKIPASRAAILSAAALTTLDAVDAMKVGNRTAFAPLLPEEVAALIEQVGIVSTALPQASFNPRFLREFALIGLAVLIFSAFVRVIPRTVIQLPTPIPSPTLPATPQPDWEATPIALPTSAAQFPAGVLYEPENPYLIWQQTHVLEQNGQLITALAISPVDPILAVGNMDDSILLWDMTTFTLLATLEGPGDVRSLAFSPDGAILASGSVDGTIRLWELPSGLLLQVLDGHQAVVSGLDFSPNGEILAAAAGLELWLWQVSGGNKIASFSHFDQTLTNVTYSPDGNFLAVSGTDGTGWVLRARDAYPLLSFKIRRYALVSAPMAFSPDGKYLVAVSDVLMVIQLKGDTDHLDGEVVKTLFENDGTHYVPTPRGMAFSPDGSFFASAMEDGRLYLWDPETWSLLQAPLVNSDYGSQSRYLAVSPDNQTIAVSRFNGVVAIWQLQDVSEQIAALPETRYFQRLDSDIYRWSYTVLDENSPDHQWVEAMDLEEISEIVGFPAKIPLVSLLGGDHQITGITYDPVQGIVYTYFSANSRPETLWGFSLLQKKVALGELMDSDGTIYWGSDAIGISAIVETVQIGQNEGEWVVGGWNYLDEENQDRPDLPQPGDQIQVVSRWSTDYGSMKLRWMEDGILYEIQAYLNTPPSDLSDVREALALLASSLFSPQQVAIPLNTSPYLYTISAGDTCTGLAERFFTTVETIANLNRLTSACLLVEGETLWLPYPAEPYATTDLDCDGQEETVMLLHDVADPTRLTGIAVDMLASANTIHRAWEYSIAEMGVDELFLPELFTVGGCEQLIALSGGIPIAGRTRVFRWNGVSGWPVLSVEGWPASPDGLITSLEQHSDETFVITIIKYVPNLHPAAGPCPNEITAFTWNGRRFEPGETRAVLGECRETLP